MSAVSDEDEVYVTPSCVHCGFPVPDYYMVNDRLWCLATPILAEQDGQMHWDCLKSRLAALGHVLTTQDLTTAPVNKWFLEFLEKRV